MYRTFCTIFCIYYTRNSCKSQILTKTVFGEWGFYFGVHEDFFPGTGVSAFCTKNFTKIYPPFVHIDKSQKLSKNLLTIPP